MNTNSQFAQQNIFYAPLPRHGIAKQYQNVIAADISLIFARYLFLFEQLTIYQNSCTLKTPQLNAPQGNIYMGARYLDPKYSRWISVDPALAEYIPGAGKSDKLPGMGGVFNSVNGNLYHYAGNNPVRYLDPDGREDIIYNRGGNFVERKESETNNVYLRDGMLDGNNLIVFDVLLTSQEKFDELVNKVYGESASLRPVGNDVKTLRDARAAIAHVAINNPDAAMRSAEANPDNKIEKRELTRCRCSVIKALTEKNDPTSGAVHFNFRGKNQGNPTTDKHDMFGNVTAAFGTVKNPISSGDAPEGEIYVVTYDGERK